MKKLLPAIALSLACSSIFAFSAADFKATGSSDGSVQAFAQDKANLRAELNARAEQTTFSPKDASAFTDSIRSSLSKTGYTSSAIETCTTQVSNPLETVQAASGTTHENNPVVCGK